MVDGQIQDCAGQVGGNYQATFVFVGLVSRNGSHDRGEFSSITLSHTEFHYFAFHRLSVPVRFFLAVVYFLHVSGKFADGMSTASTDQDAIFVFESKVVSKLDGDRVIEVHGGHLDGWMDG